MKLHFSMGTSEGLSAEQSAWILEAALYDTVPDVFVEIQEHVDSYTQADASASWSGWVHTDLDGIRPEEMEITAPGGDILWLRFED